MRVPRTALAGAALLTLAGASASAQDVELDLTVLAGWSQPVFDALEAGALRFEAANPGITVTIRRSSWNQVLVQQAAGDPPDVTLTGNGGAGRGKLWQPLMPLDDFIRASNLHDEIFGPTWNNFAWGGKVYGVPAVETGPRNGFVWNTAFLEEAGLSVDPNRPMNWEEFLAYADKLTKVAADGTIERMGFDPLNGQNSRLWNIAPMFGAEWYDPDTFMPELNNEKLVDGIQMLADRIFKKYPNFKGSTGWYGFATAENVAVTNLGVYAPGEVATRNPNMRITVTWPPQSDHKRVQVDVGWGLAIPVGAAHPQESFELIKFLATDVPFQLDLYHKSGFVGAGTEFLAALANELVTRKQDALLWYVKSMSEADVLDALWGAPINGYATGPFTTAVRKVYALDETAAGALTKVDQEVTAAMQADGLL